MWLKEGLWRDWPIYSHWPQNLISVLNAAARCCGAAAVLGSAALLLCCCSARCAGPTPQRGHDGRRLNQQNLYLLLITFAKCHPDTRSAILRVWVIAAGAITATKHHLPLNIQRGLFHPGWWGGSDHDDLDHLQMYLSVSARGFKEVDSLRGVVVTFFRRFLSSSANWNLVKKRQRPHRPLWLSSQIRITNVSLCYRGKPQLLPPATMNHALCNLVARL